MLHRKRPPTGTGNESHVRPARGQDIARTFLHWTFTRAVFHRGYVLVSSLYFVVVADLSAAQLVILGAVMSASALLADIPTGVWSDVIGRKWPLVIGHGLIGTGMVLTGLVTAFHLVVLTQVFWGVGWAFSMGADVAWLTDELDRPDCIDRVLLARARWDLVGSAIGIVGFGILGAANDLGAALVISGTGMALLGLFVAVRFGERNFRPTHHRRGRASWAVFTRAGGLARRDHEILLVLTATLIINGADQVTWLFPKRLVDLGLPDDPVLWYAALGVLALGLGVAALRVVEARIDGVGAARRTYAQACVVGSLGLLVLAYAPDTVTASVGVLLVEVIAANVTRAVSVIWINRRVASEVRATMHSFLAQSESVGEILGGVALAAVAAGAGAPATLATAGLLMGCVGVMVARSRADRLRVKSAACGT